MTGKTTVFVGPVIIEKKTNMINSKMEFPEKTSEKSRDFSSYINQFWKGLQNSFLVPVVAVIAALSIGAIILLAFGFDPVNAYGIMLEGIFGSKRNISEVLIKTTPVIFTGIAVATAYSCGVWNIGAEGQFYLGAIFAAYVGIYWAFLPAYLLIPFVFLAGFLGGGIWAIIPGLLKVWVKANEVVVTIMLNYIAMGITS